MNINAIPGLPHTRIPQSELLKQQDAPTELRQPQDQSEEQLREVFDRFVGQTFYGQLISAMRQTVGKPAYFHGGRAEEVFQGQLDQLLSEKVSQAATEKFSDPMFQLFNLARQ